MAKIVLENRLPDAEVATAVSLVERYLHSKRGRDPLMVASLASLRQNLTRAAADLQLINKKQAAECRAKAMLPPRKNVQSAEAAHDDAL